MTRGPLLNGRARTRARHDREDRWLYEPDLPAARIDARITAAQRAIEARRTSQASAPDPEPTRDTVTADGRTFDVVFPLPSPVSGVQGGSLLVPHASDEPWRTQHRAVEREDDISGLADLSRPVRVRR
jgi:hypothetical protein